MSNYAYFKKGNLEFLHPTGEIILVPDFVGKAAKNYRFNTDTDVLEKQCIGCKQFYPVQKWSDGCYYDVHDEKVIHFISDNSGYSVRCSDCTATTIERQQGGDPIFDLQTIPQLEFENEKYIRLLCIIKDCSQEEAIDFIISLVRKHNPIAYHETIN